MTCLGVQGAWAQSIFVAPTMVIRDNNSVPIGPLVGMMRNGKDRARPVIRLIDDITDSENPLPVLVTVLTPTELSVSGHTTYFLTTDCTGDAYHRVFSTFNHPMAELTGVEHSIARRGGGNMELFSSKLTDPTGTVETDSNYSEFVNSDRGGCLIESLNADYRPATLIKTLNFATPFHVTLD